MRKARAMVVQERLAHWKEVKVLTDLYEARLKENAALISAAIAFTTAMHSSTAEDKSNSLHQAAAAVVTSKVHADMARLQFHAWSNIVDAKEKQLLDASFSSSSSSSSDVE